MDEQACAHKETHKETHEETHKETLFTFKIAKLLVPFVPALLLRNAEKNESHCLFVGSSLVATSSHTGVSLVGNHCKR